MVELGDYGTGLDGDVLHLRVPDQVDSLLQASLGFRLAEDGLPQQVEVEGESLLPGVVEHRVQRLGTGVQHQVADGGAQVLSRDGHHDVRQDRGCDGARRDEDRVD